jgi:hypothetical protein
MAVKRVVDAFCLMMMLDDVWALLYVLSNVFIIQIQVVRWMLLYNSEVIDWYGIIY